MNALDYIRTLTGRRPGRGVLSHALRLWAGLPAHAYRPQLRRDGEAGWLQRLAAEKQT